MRPGREGPGVGPRSPIRVSRCKRCFNEARARRPGSGLRSAPVDQPAFHASMRPGREGPGVGGSRRRRWRGPGCFNEARARRPGSGGERGQRQDHRRDASMRPGREGPGVGPPVQALLSTLEIAPAASGPADRSPVREDSAIGQVHDCKQPSEINMFCLRERCRRFRWRRSPRYAMAVYRQCLLMTTARRSIGANVLP